jgi:hypothetical protein
LKILAQFSPVCIDVLNRKNLFTDRQDRKYIFQADKLEHVFEACLPDYNILEISGIRSFEYATTYFDTPTFDMYYQHQRGKLSRSKIRIRSYLDTNQRFIELKVKNNKGRTEKIRVKGASLHSASAEIAKSTRYAVDELHDIFQLSYQRITLIHKYKQEKVTFDQMLTYVSGENTHEIENVVFAEVKTNDGHDIHFCNIMKNHGIRSGSMSKYCLGVLMFFPEVKQNNFKLSLKKLQNITHVPINRHHWI